MIIRFTQASEKNPAISLPTSLILFVALSDPQGPGLRGEGRYRTPTQIQLPAAAEPENAAGVDDDAQQEKKNQDALQQKAAFQYLLRCRVI